jgi:hypothetical protein
MLAVDGWVLVVYQGMAPAPDHVRADHPVLVLAERFDDILAITRPQIRRVIEVRREVAGQLADIGIATQPGSATFYLIGATSPR